MITCGSLFGLYHMRRYAWLPAGIALFLAADIREISTCDLLRGYLRLGQQTVLIQVHRFEAAVFFLGSTLEAFCPVCIRIDQTF